MVRQAFRRRCSSRLQVVAAKLALPKRLRSISASVAGFAMAKREEAVRQPLGRRAVGDVSLRDGTSRRDESRGSPVVVRTMASKTRGACGQQSYSAV